MEILASLTVASSLISAASVTGLALLYSNHKQLRRKLAEKQLQIVALNEAEFELHAENRRLERENTAIRSELNRLKYADPAKSGSGVRTLESRPSDRAHERAATSRAQASASSKASSSLTTRHDTDDYHRVAVMDVPSYSSSRCDSDDSSRRHSHSCDSSSSSSWSSSSDSSSSSSDSGSSCSSD